MGVIINPYVIGGHHLAWDVFLATGSHHRHPKCR